MRRPRVKVDGEGFYHVVSRIGGKRFLIDETEKAILLGMIRGAAAFSGVELYTFAVMSNHFHLLVRIPRKKEVSNKELERRMLAWYGPGKYAAIREKWEKWTQKKQVWRVEDEKARMRARMYDLSQFCKTFKEAYTQDYNRRHENTGTIWEGRFKSILLEGSFRALMTVAGYVHLNPVRAAMVERPEESRWTGYGAGCGGDERAREGLAGLVSRAYGAASFTWEECREACARTIAGSVPEIAARPEGSPRRSGALPITAEPLAVASPSDDVIETDDRGRPVRAGSLRALLRSRVAGFLHGGALGDDRFLRRVAGCLPPRVRRHAETLLDRCAFLGLHSAAGVRGAS